jgi:hypothetical protein
VNACISELRHHGATIICTRHAAPNGGGWRCRYTLKKAPTAK